MTTKAQTCRLCAVLLEQRGTAPLAQQTDLFATPVRESRVRGRRQVEEPRGCATR